MATVCRQERREVESSRYVQRSPMNTQLNYGQCMHMRKIPEAGERTSQMHCREKPSELTQG